MSDPRLRLLDPQQFAPPLPTGRRQIGRLLVDHGLISATDLLSTLGTQQQRGVQIGQLLLARGQITADDQAVIKQRSRWLKGYLITYFTHMRRPLRLLLDLGLWRFIGFQAFFLSSISQYMLAPFIWSSLLLTLGTPEWMQSALPDLFLLQIMVFFAFAWLISIGVNIIAVLGPDHRHLIPWTLGMGPYMMLGTLAIYKGAWELLRRPFYWDKTSHGTPAAGQVHSKPLPPPTLPEAASSLSRVTKASEI